MNTKLILLAGLATGLALQICPPAMAQTFNSGAINTVIPDGSSSGLVNQINVAGLSGVIGDVSLTLDIVGAPTAYDGDYYAYLQYGSGLCVLLNEIDGGAGNNTGNGMNITLSDLGSSGSIQTAPLGSPLTGSYVPASGGASTGVGLDGTFGGMNSADGAWTLFVADETPLGVGELANWSLTLAVPDNCGTLLLLSMGVGLLGLYSMRQPRTAPVSRN
jgi:hypothetical protein